MHSMAAGMAVKSEGKANDLLERVAADPAFEAVHEKLESLVDPALFIGASPQQVLGNWRGWELAGKVSRSI